MPHFGHRKPKPTLSVTQMALSDVTVTRKAMFDSWIEEAAMIHEAFVEGLLSQLPSLKDLSDG